MFKLKILVFILGNEKFGVKIGSMRVFFLLKAIKHKTQLTWKPKYREKNHNILFLLFLMIYNRYNGGEFIEYTMR